MLVYILVLVLNGTPANVPVALPTLEACQKAGAAWVSESSKLRGMAKGDFVCVPAEKA